MHSGHWLTATALLGCTGAFAQTGDVRGVHDPCIIKAADAYYVFSTGRGRGETIPIWRASRLRPRRDLGEMAGAPSSSKLSSSDWTRCFRG